MIPCSRLSVMFLGRTSFTWKCCPPEIWTACCWPCQVLRVWFAVRLSSSQQFPELILILVSCQTYLMLRHLLIYCLGPGGVQVSCFNQCCKKSVAASCRKLPRVSGRSDRFFVTVRRWNTRSQTNVCCQSEMPGHGGTPNLQCIPSCAASNKRSKCAEQYRRPENYGNGTSAP